jgi:hypothetical protein
MLDTGSNANISGSKIQKPVSLLLRPWMKLPMHGFQSLLIDVRIYLRG